MHQFGQRVGQPARANVVNRQDRVVLTHRPAAVDHLLRTPLHLGVAALHRVEVQIFDVAARAHARGRAAAEADEHARPTELDQRRTGDQRQLAHLRLRDITHAAGDHDRLVIAALLARRRLLEGAEVAEQIGTTEFVVEARRADRTVEHDLQRRRNPARLAVVLFPGLLEIPGCADRTH